MHRFSLSLIVLVMSCSSVSQARSFLRFVEFCAGSLRAIVHLDFVTPGEMLKLQPMVNKIDRAIQTNADLFGLVENTLTILNENDIHILTELRPAVRSQAVIQYAPFLSYTQIEKIEGSRDFRTVDDRAEDVSQMLSVLRRQIEKFDRMKDMAENFRLSMAMKDQEKGLAVNLNVKANRNVRTTIYDFIQNRADLSGNPVSIIKQEIRHVRNVLLSKIRTTEVRYSGTMMDIQNSFLESYIKLFLTRLNGAEFLEIIQDFFKFKKETYIPVLQALKKPLENVIPPESWIFYGEIFRLSRQVKFRGEDLERLWNITQPSVHNLARVEEQYKQFMRQADDLDQNPPEDLEIPASSWFRYYPLKGGRRFEDLWKKIWNYAYKDSASKAS